jgi:hypothetical protein
VLVEGSAIPVWTKIAQKLRRLLDIREQKRDRSGGLLHPQVSLAS